MATTYTLIQPAVVVGSGGATDITFSAIPATYTDLVVKLSSRTNRANAVDFLQINFNGSAASFTARGIEGNGASAASYTDTVFIGATSGNSATASTFGNLEIYIPNYAGSSNKSYSADSVSETNGTTAYTELVAGLWSNTAAITSIKLLSATANNFLQYSTAYLYGVSNA